MTRLTDLTDAVTGARRRDARQAEEFADLLESGRTLATGALAPLVSLARALSPAAHRPEPTFRTALRAQLVAEATARVPALPAPRAPEKVRPSAPRWRHAVAALAVTSAVTGVGTAAASSQALPGDTLYGLKLRIEAIQLSLADSDLERGRELLEQAEARLGEAEQLASAGTISSTNAATRAELANTLTTMDLVATAGAAALVESYDQTGDPESMLLLARFVDRQQLRLQALSVGLDPGLRASAQRALDTLALVENATRAVLSPTARETNEASGLPGLARADDWAVSRGALPPSAATGSGSVGGATSTKGTNGMGGMDGMVNTDAAPSASDGPTDATGATAGAAGTGSSIPSVTSTPALTGAATPVPDPAVPVPSVAAPPAPTATSPVPDPTTSLLPSATAPAPTLTCVAVLPLTTC